MAVPSKYILHQGPTLAGLCRTAAAALKQKVISARPPQPGVPGPEVSRTFPPRSPDLVKAYVKHVGGNPSDYKETLPYHLFPQWGFALAAQTLKGIPYPMLKVMNGGCRIEIKAPLPLGEALDVRARLENIDDNGSRAVLHQRITTGTASTPEALVANLYAVVPLRSKSQESRSPRKPKARVPEQARELKYWEIKREAGLDFAKLTGDFNPIHWIPAHARAFGFKNTILHGFSTMARAIEGLNQTRLANGKSLSVFDAQFTRPLVLPAKVGLYEGDDNTLYVGDAPGGPAYMVATYETRDATQH